MVRLGAVTYLNARPLVYGLERSDRFSVRYDIPSECARLLHARQTDVGLIPSIEYLRGPGPYALVPGPAVISRGPVASVALAAVLLRRRFGVTAQPAPMAPDLDAMLASADAALIIGDVALFLDHAAAGAHKIDLGDEWTALTGLPFVYACWTGWPGVLTRVDVDVLRRARDEGVAQSDAVASAYYPDDTTRQAVARRYLRDNIRYFLGGGEIEGLKTFYRYASELGLADFDGTLRFYDADDQGAR